MEGATSPRKFSARDASRLREILSRLKTVAPEWPGRAPAPAWLVGDLRELLGCERAVAYRPDRHANGAWYLGEPATTDAAVFSAYSDWMSAASHTFLYDPLRPESWQRNRALTLEDIHIHDPDGSCVVEEVWPRVGLGGQDQVRALVCEGPILLAWVGGFRREPFTDRERRLLAALVPTLRRALGLHRRLLDAGIASVGFVLALEAVGAPSLVARRDGTVLHANSCGKALLDRLGRDASRRVVDAIAGRDERAFVARLDAPGIPECHLVVFRDVALTLHRRLAAAQAHWHISRRECETLEQVVAGKCNKEIAIALGVHVGSVERHLTSLLRKARCDSRAQLIVRFWTSGVSPASRGVDRDLN